MMLLRRSKKNLGWTVLLLAVGLLPTLGHGVAVQRTDLGQIKQWKPGTPIPYLVNPNGVPNFGGELQRLVVVGALNDAFRAWTQIPGAAIAFSGGGISAQTNAGIDGTNLVTFSDTATQFGPGVLAVALVASAPAVGPITLGDRTINAEFVGQILDADIVFNSRAATFSPVGANNTVDLVSVGIHEVGHLLGLDHTGVLSSIMNPFAESGGGTTSRTVQSDDALTAAVLYPGPSLAGDRGTIVGTITTVGGAPVKSANVVVVSATGGVPVTSQLTVADGSYRIPGLPPGTYRVLVEPLDGPIFLGNFPGFYSSGNPSFATNFFGGLSLPTPITLAAGQQARADVIVQDKSPSALNIAQLGTSTQTAAGTSFSFGAAPLFLPRGRSFQIFVTGSNLGSDSNLTQTGTGVTGQGTTALPLPDGTAARQQSVNLSGNAPLGPSNLLLSNAATTSAYPGGIVTTVNPNISAILNAGGFGRALGPGAIFSLFGTDLASGRGDAGTEGWLGPPAPTNMGGVSVKVGDRYAPLFFVSPGQINGLIPFETTGSSVPVTVVTGPNASGNTVTVSLTPSAPGIFTVPPGDQGAILNGTDNTVAAPAGTFPGSRPARPGDVIVIYASGMGPVTPALPSGVGSGAEGSTIPVLSGAPRVTIGGQTATVQFAGLSPGFVGLYQLNVVVPATAPGSAVPVVITTAQGQASNTATMAVGP